MAHTPRFAIVISTGWRAYHANSPYKLFLELPVQEEFIIYEVSDDFKSRDPGLHQRICGHEAIVVSLGLEHHFTDYHSGPILLLLDDTHRFNKETSEQLIASIRQCHYFLGAYRLSRPWGDYPYFFIPQDIVDAKWIFFPHSAAPKEINYPLRDNQLPKASLTGAIDIAYPVRSRLLEMSTIPTYHIERIDHKQFVGKNFIDMLGRYRAGMTCNLWLDYTIAKYYEIPCSGSILIAPLPRDPLERALLGFEDGANMFCINRNDLQINEKDGTSRLLTKLNYILQDQSVETVRKNGHDLVIKRHTIASRLNYLSALLQIIISSGLNLADQFDIFMNSSDICAPSSSDQSHATS